MKKIPELQTKPIATCDQCGATTRLEIIADGHRSMVQCICECEREEFEREEAERARKRSERLQNRVLAHTFGRIENIPDFTQCDAYTPSQALNTAKAYVERFAKMRISGQGLMLYGEAGHGKTFLAECIANALCQRFNVQVITAPNLASMSLFEDGLELVRNDLLILDDLGTQRDSAYADEKIFNLVNDCYSSFVPLIVTTNLTPQEMMIEAPGTKQRAYSRILERCLPVKVSSTRKRVASTNYDQIKRNLGLL